MSKAKIKVGDKVIRTGIVKQVGKTLMLIEEADGYSSWWDMHEKWRKMPRKRAK